MVSAWSIPKATRKDPKKTSEEAPGPGAYTGDKKQKFIPPKWGIGTSSRGSLAVSKVPGPGNYESKNTNDSSKYSMAQKLSYGSPDKFGSTPGPGAYQPSTALQKAHAPNYPMGMKTDYINDNQKMPGPGSYESKSSVNLKHSAKIGTGNRGNLYNTNRVPGPGNYSDVDKQNPKSPSWGFGSGTRNGFYQSPKTPGPGSYEKQSGLTNMSKSMSSRWRSGEQLEASRVPGPGAYNPSRIDKSANQTWKIGTEERGKLNREAVKTPGPG